MSGIEAKIKSLTKEGKDTEAQKKNLAKIGKRKPFPPKIPVLIYDDITPEELREKIEPLALGRNYIQ